MPSSDVIIRKSISFPVSLEREIFKQATKNNRSFSAQVVHEMHYVMERAKRRRLVVAQPSVSHRPMRLEENKADKPLAKSPTHPSVTDDRSKKWTIEESDDSEE